MSETNGLQQQYAATLNQMRKLKDQMALQGLIVKDQPHAALFTWATRELMAERDRQALHVLLDIANHANEYGWCYPSFLTLGKNTGYSQNTVKNAVDRLMARDWLRVHAVMNPRRNRVEKDFMVSPAILYIRPEIREDAWTRFNELPNCNSFDESVTRSIKPSTEPTTVTNIKNQHQEPTSKPASAASPKAKAATAEKTPANGTAAQQNPYPTDNPKNPSDSTPVQPGNANQTRSDNPAPPRSGTPPPKHPKLPLGFDPGKAMSDAKDEAAAQELYRMLDTLQIRYARCYIARYPRDLVLATAKAAKIAPHVGNPVGKMDTDLRRQLADVTDGAKDDSGRKYVSGKDADWIEH